MNEIRDLYVDDNKKICTVCSKCGAYKVIAAPDNIHRATLNCPECGQKTKFRINWRKSPRKEYTGLAVLGKDLPIKLINLSVGGLAFEGPDVKIPVGTKTEFSFFLGISKKGRTKVIVSGEIVSVNGNKYGIKFLDLKDYSNAKKDIFFWLQ